jgi:8-oxo-dGTP pyrophosphatase MutT (NUDIX family)
VPERVREFTVAIFVVQGERVLLHKHRRLARWLPPGGHIDPGELPDEAAVRETLEETGVAVELLNAPGAPLAKPPVADGEPLPPRLVQPLGIQLEDIGPGHQHIDLIYVARPVARHKDLGEATLLAEEGASGLGWYGPKEWDQMGVSAEVRGWAEAALDVTRSHTW